MSRWRGAAVLMAIFTMCVGSAFVWRWRESERAEDLHAERDETPVSIGVVAPRADCEIMRAGDSLDAAVSRGPCSSGAWLGPGRYFAKATLPSGTTWHPIPILGYRLGPERDGGFVLTIRPRATEEPAKGFAYIPSGYFLIGDRTNPREPHYVWVAAYWIGIFEITNAEFRAFLNDRSGYLADENWTVSGRAWKLANKSAASALLCPADEDCRRFGQDDQPVTNVTWFEAFAYCRWRTRAAAGGSWNFALPTDAEWEKAARGPDGFDWGLGNRISDHEERLYNWKKNPGVAVTVVGWSETERIYRPNRYGLYHASGNVAEWTASAFWPYNRQQPYADDRRNDPELAERRSVRGGSWYSATSAPLYLPYRDAFQPERRSGDLGFRVLARRQPGH